MPRPSDPLRARNPERPRALGALEKFQEDVGMVLERHRAVEIIPAERAGRLFRNAPADQIQAQKLELIRQKTEVRVALRGPIDERIQRALRALQKIKKNLPMFGDLIGRERKRASPASATECGAEFLFFADDARGRKKFA